MANMASACALMSSGDDGKMMFRPTCRWRAREAANTCMLVSVAVICVCILVVCGVLLVREYALARAYVETTCTIDNVSYSARDVQCMHCSGAKERIDIRAANRHSGGLLALRQTSSHQPNRSSGRQSLANGGVGSACVTSQFPCVRVVVDYVTVDGVHHDDALLHPDSLQAAGLYSQCSYDVCLRDRHDNWLAVERYSARWRSAQRARMSFTCYYNAAEFGDVIVEKVYSESDVIHSMFWPSLVIVVCCVVFLRLETRRRRLTFCGRRGDANSPLLLMQFDYATENTAHKIGTFLDGARSQLPTAPPSTPQPLTESNSHELLPVCVIVEPSSKRHRQLSLPTDEGQQHPQHPRSSATYRPADENDHVTVARYPTRMWSSSITLTELSRDSAQVVRQKSKIDDIQ